MFELNRRLGTFLIRLSEGFAVRVVFFVIGMNCVYAGLTLWAVCGLSFEALGPYAVLITVAYGCVRTATRPNRTQQDKTPVTFDSGIDPVETDMSIREALRIVEKSLRKIKGDG